MSQASVPEHYAPKATLMETNVSVITSPQWLDAAMEAAHQLAGEAQEHPLALMDQAAALRPCLRAHVHPYSVGLH